MPIQKVTVVCGECGIESTRYPSQVRPSGETYCSRRCATEASKRGKTYPCALCDEEFYRRPGEADGEKQFCSRECYAEWRKANRKGTTYPKIGPRHAHRVVAEAVLGRALKKGEVVHHIDGDRCNNHPSNLAVFPSQSDHVRCHAGSMSAAELNGFRLEGRP